VTAARAELERLEVPHLRPDDYFAEMMKSDEHMQKVRSRAVSCWPFRCWDCVCCTRRAARPRQYFVVATSTTGVTYVCAVIVYKLAEAML